VALQNVSPEALVTFRAPGSERGVEPAQVVAGMPFEVPDPAETVMSALVQGFLLAFERVAGLFQGSAPRRVELELVEEGYVDDRTRGLGLIDDLYVLRVGAAFLGT